MSKYEDCNYRITQKGRGANPSARHNKETWGYMKSVLMAHGIVNWAQLSKACANHNHPAGGDAFIPYVERYGWIKQV